MDAMQIDALNQKLAVAYDLRQRIADLRSAIERLPEASTIRLTLTRPGLYVGFPSETGAEQYPTVNLGDELAHCLAAIYRQVLDSFHIRLDQLEQELAAL